LILSFKSLATAFKLSNYPTFTKIGENFLVKLNNNCIKLEKLIYSCYLSPLNVYQVEEPILETLSLMTNIREADISLTAAG
jgi:hypothetical protein